MFFVLSLCCLGSQREFVHVPSTELSSKIHQKQLVMTHHNSSLTRNWLCARVGVSSVGLSSSCKSYNCYTYTSLQLKCSLSWALTFLQEPQFLHFPWLLTLLCVPSLVSLQLGFLRLAKTAITALTTSLPCQSECSLNWAFIIVQESQTLHFRLGFLRLAKTTITALTAGLPC